MFRQVIIALSIVSLTGQVKGKTSIIQGKDANIEDFPYQVSLRYKNKHFCGGSIISEKHVLTASHCFEDGKRLPYHFVTAVTGTSYLDHLHGHHRPIDNVILHPDFLDDDHRVRHDVAVVTLEERIIFDKYQRKINLPKHNFKVGEEAVVTGWGYINQHPPILPKILQKLKTKIMSTEECQKKVVDPNELKIYKTELCTIRSHGSGICSGDSGGPLVVHDELVGIASWLDGDQCADIHPDVYTNVYKYKHFIESIIHETK